MVTFVSSAETHAGRVRDHNEDSVVCTARLVAVADGLGGHAAGEVASRIAVDRLAALAAQREFSSDELLTAVLDANRLVHDEGARNPKSAGLGTTLCGVALVTVEGSEQCAVFNVGDSRVYAVRDGELEQVSVDHSEVQELLDAGLLTPDAATQYVRRNIVTRWLGGEADPEPDLWLIRADGALRFLVCTDGLTNEVPDADIAAVLAEHAAPDAAARALVERALAAGGRDNISVAVVDVMP